ncbi:MAG TPA: type II CAAX endopeptidase family protein [Clostridia bacterium]
MVSKYICERVWCDKVLMIGIILRVILVEVIAILLSLLANSSAKSIGIDIKDIKQRTNPKFLLLAVVFNLLFILAVGIILKLLDSKDIGVLNWRINSVGIIFSLLAIFSTFVLAFGFILILNTKKIISAKYVSMHISNSYEVFIKIFGFSVLFIAALQEEVMFRGYLNTVLSVYGILCAMIFSSLIFMVWHFMTNRVNLFQAVDWFLGGIMLFYVYSVSGSIWVTAAVHFSRNFVNVLVFNITNDNSLITLDKPIRPFHKTIYTLILSIVIMLLTYLYYGNILL